MTSCTTCGSELNAGVRYCRSCGVRLAQAPAPTAQAPAPTAQAPAPTAQAPTPGLPAGAPPRNRAAQRRVRRWRDFSRRERRRTVAILAVFYPVAAALVVLALVLPSHGATLSASNPLHAGGSSTPVAPPTSQSSRTGISPVSTTPPAGGTSTSPTASPPWCGDAVQALKLDERAALDGEEARWSAAYFDWYKARSAWSSAEFDGEVSPYGPQASHYRYYGAAANAFFTLYDDIDLILADLNPPALVGGVKDYQDNAFPQFEADLKPASPYWAKC